VKIETSVFEMNLFTVNYLADSFFENVVVQLVLKNLKE